MDLVHSGKVDSRCKGHRISGGAEHLESSQKRRNKTIETSWRESLHREGEETEGENTEEEQLWQQTLSFGNVRDDVTDWQQSMHCFGGKSNEKEHESSEGMAPSERSDEDDTDWQESFQWLWKEDSEKGEPQKEMSPSGRDNVDSSYWQEHLEWGSDDEDSGEQLVSTNRRVAEKRPCRLRLSQQRTNEEGESSESQTAQERSEEDESNQFEILQESFEEWEPSQEIETVEENNSTNYLPPLRRPPLNSREEKRTLDPVSLSIRDLNLTMYRWRKDFKEWWRDNPRPNPINTSEFQYYLRKDCFLISIQFMGHEMPRQYPGDSEHEDFILNDFKPCWIACPTREWRKRQASRKKREDKTKIPKVFHRFVQRFREINCCKLLFEQ